MAAAKKKRKQTGYPGPRAARPKRAGGTLRRISAEGEGSRTGYPGPMIAQLATVLRGLRDPDEIKAVGNIIAQVGAAGSKPDPHAHIRKQIAKMGAPERRVALRAPALRKLVKQ